MSSNRIVRKEIYDRRQTIHEHAQQLPAILTAARSMPQAWETVSHADPVIGKDNLIHLTVNHAAYRLLGQDDDQTNAVAGARNLLHAVALHALVEWDRDHPDHAKRIMEHAEHALGPAREPSGFKPSNRQHNLEQVAKVFERWNTPPRPQQLPNSCRHTIKQVKRAAMHRLHLQAVAQPDDPYDRRLHHLDLLAYVTAQSLLG